MRGASMGYEIEFKLIDIKDINKFNVSKKQKVPLEMMLKLYVDMILQMNIAKL